jgi:hypothetical protein
MRVANPGLTLAWHVMAVVLVLGFGFYAACWWSQLQCRHQNVRMPMHGRQECLECKRMRDYQFGSKPGRWRRI